MNVLQLSPTPLVMAPELLSSALNSYTDISSKTILFSDYPNKLAGIFIREAIVFSKTTKDLISVMFKKADIITIHNSTTPVMEEMIKEFASPDVKFVYVAHSPQHEGPLFFNPEIADEIDYDAKLVIGQYQPRHYQDSIIVPNITMFDPIDEVTVNEVPKVMFNPAHTKTGGRWNDKTSFKLNEIITSLDKLGLIELINIQGVRPDILFEYRKQADFTIDEIVTGAFHKVSLEGLCAGNATINNADFFSLQMIKGFSKHNELPPFVTANENTIQNILLDKDSLLERKKASVEYYKRNLHPSHLVGFYEKAYKEL